MISLCFIRRHEIYFDPVSIHHQISRQIFAYVYTNFNWIEFNALLSRILSFCFNVKYCNFLCENKNRVVKHPWVNSVNRKIGIKYLDCLSNILSASCQKYKLRAVGWSSCESICQIAITFFLLSSIKFYLFQKRTHKIIGFFSI